MSPDAIWSISAEIRRRRREAGLSLSELARRADTSVSTLSRYENGWGRFELATLRKLATALRCRLVVHLEPVRSGSRTVTRRATRAAVVRRLGRLFWDRELSPGDLAAYPRWVVERVLEYGTLEDVHCLIDFMGREDFLDVVRRARFQSARTRSFWRQMLAKQGLTCTKERFPRTAWRS